MDKMNASEDDVLRARTAAASESGERTIWAVLLGGCFSTLGGAAGDLDSSPRPSRKRRAEQELRRRETELREAQRVANVGSWEWIIQTGAIIWSEELYHIAGRTPGPSAQSYSELPQT